MTSNLFSPSGFINTEAEIAAMIIVAVTLYASTEIISALVNLAITTTPALLERLVDEAIVQPNAYFSDFNSLFSNNDLMRDTLMLNKPLGTDTPETFAELRQRQEFKDNVNMLHYIIIHGETQKLILAQLQETGTLNILLDATIDRDTTVSTANSIRADFNILMSQICATTSRDLEIKCTIILNNTTDLMVMVNPFLPCLDILSRHTWHLSTLCYQNPEVCRFIHDVSNNTDQLMAYINYLRLQVVDLDEMVLLPINEYTAEPVWVVMQQKSQLLRYLQWIYNTYHPEYNPLTFFTPIEVVDLDDG